LGIILKLKLNLKNQYLIGSYQSKTSII